MVSTLDYRSKVGGSRSKARCKIKDPGCKIQGNCSIALFKLKLGIITL